MSLETVVADIRTEAEETAAEIRERAEEQAAAIVAEAEREADETLEETEAAVERRINRERERRLSSANLEAKQERLAARRDVLNEVRTRVAASLREIDGERREELTRAALSAGIDQLDTDGDVRVYGREGDTELLEAIVADEDGVDVAGTYECIGGVILESDAARLRVNNTFDSILDAVWEDKLKEISDRLFEQ